MNKPNVKKYIIVILVILGVVFLNLTFKSLSNKPVILDTVKLKEIKVDKKTFGIFIEKNSYSGEDDKYEKYDGDTWPTEYILNDEKTGCVDVNGLLIDNAINYEDGTVSVTTGKTAYCYVYFDKIRARNLGYTNASYTECGDIQCTIDELYEKVDYANELLTLKISDKLEAGLYRYQGYNADNYICFGTTDKNTCTSDTDKYMYRIIGKTENNQLKLIKKEALNTAYAWNTANVKNVKWNESTLYSGLNGSFFLTNTAYVPSGWENRIANTAWKYGSVNNIDASVEEIASSEEEFTNTVNAKIGLMYLSDYTYSYADGKNCTQSGTCRKTWISLSLNDKSAPVAYEWTMTKYGIFLYSEAWSLSGHASEAISKETFSELSVRPVFYLNVGETTASGDGTLENPFMLS